MDMTNQDESTNVIDSRGENKNPEPWQSTYRNWYMPPRGSKFVSPGVGGAISDAIDAIKTTIKAFHDDPGHEDTRVPGNEVKP